MALWSVWLCSYLLQLIFTNGCGLSAHSRVISGGTLLPSTQYVGGSKPVLWLSNHVCAVSREFGETHYQYTLIESKGDVAAEKICFPAGNEVRHPVNMASGMCRRFWTIIPSNPNQTGKKAPVEVFQFAGSLTEKRGFRAVDL